MTRQLLLACLFLPGAIQAQLAPGTPAPLIDHLREVNAEWRSFTGTLPGDPVTFTNDTERIARHLHLVRAQLASHMPEGLSAGQAHEREQLLGTLKTYADRGVFPKNYVLPYRNPIFIDPHRTACAVGHLMIQSGAVDLAARIDAEMETAYIRDMQWPEIGAWAREHGFTADELAWIQPGYSPPINWFPVGGGTNGTVDEVLALANGDLLVAGQFTDAGGTACNGAAIWNGSSYTPLGELPEGLVNCAIEHAGELFIGGSFNGGQIDLLRWSGGGWTGEAVFQSKAGEVTALLSHDGMLYAAGSASGFAGVDYSMKVLQEGEWLQTPGWLNGPIHALEFHDGYIIAGGSFTGAFASSNEDILHVARYMDSGWNQVADGLNGDVHDLLVHDGHLYATGDMVAELGTSFGLSRIAPTSAAWEPLMPNIQNYIYPSPVDAPSIGKAMVVHDDRIFITGEITTSMGLTYGTGVIAFNGAPDDVEPYCDMQGYGNSITLLNSDQLVVGGASQLYANILATDLTSGVSEATDRLALSISPNPTRDVVNVVLPEGLSAANSMRVTDVKGRIVQVPVQRTATGAVIDAKGLARGAYQVEIEADGRIATGRFVKD